MTDYTLCTAIELADLYCAGSASPVTVAEQILNKIDRLNPVLNAFCYLDPATTLAQAQASAQRWQQNNPLSKLDGVPVAVKDSILTQGWPTLHASRTVDADQSWAEDAPSVARLREAGAVFVGKTTMSEFGSSPNDSDSILYGQVCNPWNLGHSPGGSSGGSAVAVSAGLVPVALGSDFGGSITIPSAFCGIFGMKPSAGRVPQWPIDVLELSTVGPLARSTVDIRMAMNIIVRPDVRDGTALPYDKVNYCTGNKTELSGKRIACVKFLSGIDIDPLIVESVEKIADYLLQQGAHVDFITVDIDSAIGILVDLPLPKLWQQWSDIPKHKRHLTERAVQHRSILACRPDDTHNQLIARHQLITRTRKIMQSYDALLGPATVVDSHRHAITAENISPLSIFFCLTKQPTITIPIGVDSNGMPQSVMIAGAMYNDIGVLEIAQTLESAFPMPACPVIL